MGLRQYTPIRAVIKMDTILTAIPALIILRFLGHFLLFLCVVNAQKTTIFSGDGGLPGGSSAALPPGCKQKLCFCLAFNQIKQFPPFTAGIAGNQPCYAHTP